MSKTFDFVEMDPEEICSIYSSGFKGSIGSKQQSLLAAAASDDFYSVYPQAKDAGRRRLLLPYIYALAFDPGFGRDESQTTGDCVSMSTRWAGMINYTSDAYLGLTTYEGRFATENIYGWRGHRGQGAHCGRLATYVSTSGPGGFLVRKNYGNGVDLSRYTSSIGHNWGGPGTPTWLNTIAASNKAMRVYQCTSMNMAIDALAFGFGLSVCSGYGFNNVRNQHGLCEVKGGWNHAMSWVGCDATDWAYDNYGGPIPLVQNSWGPWNRGPKRFDQPDGSFFIRPAIAEAMIRGGGAYIIGSVRGYDRILDYGQERVEKLCKDINYLAV